MSQIQEFDFSVDLLRALLWQYNDAARLEALLRQKQDWYDANQTAFWEDWVRDVFDLRTANDFGLTVWATILDIPLVVASAVDPVDKPIWGFGQYRENFNNGNFASLSNSQLTTDQKRLVLRLRYFQLVTRGTVPEINEFFAYLFGNMGGPALAPGIYPQYALTDVARCIRSTTATYLDAQGLIVTAAANTARVGSLGLLVEAEATNTALYSERFDNAFWSKFGAVSVILNSAIAPDGANTANCIVASDGVDPTLLRGICAAQAAGTAVVASIYVKAGTSPQSTFNVYDAGNAECNLIVTWVGGVPVRAAFSGPAGATAQILSINATGWYRLVIAWTTAFAAECLHRFWPCNRYIPTQTGNVYAWGAQLEVGTAPSSYIPTTSAAVTRAADEIHISDPSTPGQVYVNDGYDMTARYVFQTPLSSDLETVLTGFDLLPRPAAVKVDFVIIGDADGWGFGRYHENFTNGNFYHA